MQRGGQTQCCSVRTAEQFKLFQSGKTQDGDLQDDGAGCKDGSLQVNAQDGNL